MSRRYFDVESEVAFYHVIIKVPERTDINSAYALNDDHKLYFERLMHRLESIYLIDIPAYCIMSTHVHFIMSRKAGAEKEISLKETALRYQKYYELFEPPDARSHEVRQFRQRLNDLSEFMRDMQRRFTFWYNNQFEVKRTGSLWNPRFKSIALRSGKALADCMKYVELNPVRAKMVKSPGEYKFSSWGHICKNDSWGKYHRGSIKKYLYYFYKHLTDNKGFRNYAEDLEVLSLYVKDNKAVKRIDPYVQAYLLDQCSLWSRLKAIGGDEQLSGVGYGNKRPRIIVFNSE
jgi:REP element-mobilizing transposase RayT